MALTELAVKNAKPRAKDYKLTDALGMHLLVRVNGSKSWNLSYRIDGKQKKLTIGTYPAVGLALARARRTEARALLAFGKDPSQQKKA